MKLKQLRIRTSFSCYKTSKFCFKICLHLCCLVLLVLFVTLSFICNCDVGVTISFALAGASCVLNALCYAELASRFPAVVGGAYLYTYTTFNELTAFLVFAQLMLDYHIGAASIARSLASYVVTTLELFPFFKDIPNWIGNGEEFLGGALSINLLAPILLTLLTIVLCRGIRESSTVNSFMTVLKVLFPYYHSPKSSICQ